MKKIKYLFLLIVALGSFVRLLFLDKFPPGLNFDEILYGLDAYSILNTGRDIYGHFMPLAFQSSGYYPPLYTYILVPFVLIFDLSFWTVRIPSALAGSFSIIVIFFLTYKLFPSKKKQLPLLSAALLAFLPWHIHLTRVAFLAGIGNVFIMLGIYFFIISKGEKSKLLLSSTFFIFSVFSHYGYLFFSTCIFLILIFIYRNKFRLDIKKLIYPGLIGIAFFCLIMVAYSKYNLSFRVNQLSITTPKNITLEYVKTFSPIFLFISGDNYRLANPWGKGQLPYFLIPFVLFGLFKLLSVPKSSALLMLFMLLLIPIPSASVVFTTQNTVLFT